MNSTQLLDRTYEALARSRWAVRAAVRARGIASAVVGKRLAPSTLAERNGEYRLLGELPDGVRTVVDVGANVGDWSAAAMRRWPGLELIVCFEPGTTAADELERRLGADARLRVVRRALSDSPTQLTFWEEPSGGTMSSGVPGHSGSASVARRVEASTLDAELSRLGVERVDVLKIDAEGLDLHVLRGAQRTLAGGLVEVVQFEYNDAWQQAGSTLREAYSLLAHAGYRTLLLTPSGLREFPLEATTELFTYANFVALPPRQLARFEPVLPVW
jgi:FkbM family methyltransferase